MYKVYIDVTADFSDRCFLVSTYLGDENGIIGYYPSKRIKSFEEIFNLIIPIEQMKIDALKLKDVRRKPIPNIRLQAEYNSDWVKTYQYS